MEGPRYLREAGDPSGNDLWPYCRIVPRAHHPAMPNISPAILIVVAILILAAVAAGTLTARFFMAASRADGGIRSHEDL